MSTERYSFRQKDFILKVHSVYVRVLAKCIYYFYYPGSFHQYDSMAYPETKAKGVFVKAWDALKDVVGKGSTDELIIPDHTTMQTKALNVYLEKYQKVLVDCELSPQFNIVHLSEKVEHIFRQLYAQLLSIRYNPWIANGLAEVCRILCAVCQKLTIYVMYIILLHLHIIRSVA